MAVKKVAAREDQLTEFKFTEKNDLLAKLIIKKYPEGRTSSAVMPLLDLVQRQIKDNWIPIIALSYIAKFLNMKPNKVYEVASFYSMYNLAPVGKYFIQLCRTTPCWLCGSNNILNVCKNFLNIDLNETTDDSLFTLVEVECLGGCVNAPVIQINDDYYEDLTEESVISILKKLKNDEIPKTGPQVNRKCSEPIVIDN